MIKVIAYTDGSCDNKAIGKCGGWASIIEFGELSWLDEISGSDISTSSARMELIAVQQTLNWCINKFYTSSFDLNIFSDAEYISKAFNEDWIWTWIKKDWIGVKNEDIWQLLLKQLGHRRVNSFTISHVKGHTGIIQNEKADKLARQAREQQFKVYKENNL